MSSISSKIIFPVVPVYKGGDLFIGALGSIEESEIPFRDIIVSFNGKDPDDFERFQEAKQSGRLKAPYIVFRTLAEISALDHALFILHHLKNICPAESMLFMLAHDDRVLQLSRMFFSTVDRGTVYFPSYHCCTAGEYNDITHVIESDQRLTPDEFFWLTMRENIATNMSGMVVSILAYEETLLAMKRSGSGARFEHLIAISGPVKEVCFHKDIKVLVGERPDSDGKQLTSLQHRAASLNYVIAYARNGRLRPAFYVPYLIQLAKKTLALAFCKIRLGFSA